MARVGDAENELAWFNLSMDGSAVKKHIDSKGLRDDSAGKAAGKQKKEKESLLPMGLACPLGAADAG